MALTSVTITKQSVNQSMKGQYSVIWELKGFDEATELFSATFSEDYKTGDNISRVEAGFRDQMQDYIDKYKKEQQYLNAAAHNTAVANVQAALEV
jgi:hypothetical protein